MDPSEKAVQILNHLHKLEIEQQLKQARYLEQQETYRLARKAATQAIRKLFGLRPITHIF